MISTHVLLLLSIQFVHIYAGKQLLVSELKNKHAFPAFKIDIWAIRHPKKTSKWGSFQLDKTAVLGSLTL
ncbi:MAG: hypothetical protein WC044_10160 [Crocinitomicaceae bacterium]